MKSHFLKVLILMFGFSWFLLPNLFSTNYGLVSKTIVIIGMKKRTDSTTPKRLTEDIEIINSTSISN